MNSDQLNVWLTNVMQEPLPEWVQLGAQDIADEVKRQWGDKARMRAQERYSSDRQACRASSQFDVSVTISLTCMFQRESHVANPFWTLSPQHTFYTKVSDTTWINSPRWLHTCKSAFDITFDSRPQYDLHGRRYVLDGTVHELLIDQEDYLSVQEVLQGMELPDRQHLLLDMLKRWLHGTHEHHWIAAAPNVHRCLFCHTLRAKKPKKQAYYRVDGRAKVTTGTSKQTPCKFVRPRRGSYTEEQMDMALRIARDDNFTISSLK
jgi:hypothetical protein